MRTVRLPGGEEVPALGQGTWYMGDDALKRSEEIAALRAGVDLGMTLIDTAEMYGNGRAEELVGEAVAGLRGRVFLVSKVLPSNASRQGTKKACEGSLKRLRTDVIDLYLLHWQGRYPFEETVAGMTDLQREGKIRYWGVSNMDVPEMRDIFSIPRGDTCAVNQVLYNLSRRGVEYDLLPWCRENALPVMAYSPVEQGRILKDRTLGAVAKRHGATPAQVALAWVLRDPGVIAIPKAGTVAHVKENAAAGLVLTPDDLAELDGAFHPPARKMPLEML
ncbi:MAG: aldo/keto reductase [Deltaproteobacteria bacterium]|nr:aldo/keto reductase [Deltaproteobacteria bacterium]